MRAPRPVLPVLLALLACACGPPRPADLVLVTVDTLRPDRLGSYGHPGAHTPVTDRLARDGVRFEAAATTFPRTTPALASLHTGLLPKHHGSREVGQPFERGRTLAERLAAAGYQTAAAVGTRAADQDTNLHRGFERFSASRKDPTTESALALVRRLDPERPLFLWVHYREPHFPYQAPAGFAAAGSTRACDALAAELEAQRLPYGAVFGNRHGRSAAARADCERAYDAEIAFTDQSIGELLAALAALGRMQRTFVVLTSDHGENLGEGELWYEHGPSVHEAGLRIPLIVAGPGLRPAVRREPVWLEDLAPTLLALLGVGGGDEPLDGADLSPLLRAGSAAPLPERLAFAESGSALNVHDFSRLFSGRADDLHCYNEGRFSLCARPGEDPRLYDHEADPELTRDLGDRHPEVQARLLELRRRWPPETLRERSARDGRFKWIERPSPDGGQHNALYDLAADPAETRDVSAAHPDVARRLAAALAAWNAPLPPPAERDAETVRALRALGYVE